MKYIDLLNGFWQANRQLRFTTSERELYFYLLHEANSCYWHMPFSCPTSIICTVIGLSRPSVIRAREGLSKRGFITFTEGVQNSRAPSYIVQIPKPIVTARVTARETDGVTARETTIKDKDRRYDTSKEDETKKGYEELVAILTADAAWIEQIVFAVKKEIDCPLTTTDIPAYLEEFVQMQRLRGDSEREEADFRMHFFNWLRKHVKPQNQNPNKNGETEEKYSQRRGVDATYATAEEFEAPFPTSNGTF